MPDDVCPRCGQPMVSRVVPIEGTLMYYLDHAKPEPPKAGGVMVSNRPRRKLEHSPVRITAHDPLVCTDQPCTIHNRTDHHMRGFPQHYRYDRDMMERICPHGIGHPDPDDFRLRTGADPGVHGCDGCCLDGRS